MHLQALEELVSQRGGIHGLAEQPQLVEFIVAIRREYPPRREAMQEPMEPLGVMSENGLYPHAGVLVL